MATGKPKTENQVQFVLCQHLHQAWSSGVPCMWSIWVSHFGRVAAHLGCYDRLAISYELFRTWSRERKIQNLVWNPWLTILFFWLGGVAAFLFVDHTSTSTTQKTKWENTKSVYCSINFVCIAGTHSLDSRPRDWHRGSTAIPSFNPRRLTHLGVSLIKYVEDKF